MITGLDHVVALVRDIGAARAAYQTLLGRAPAWQNCFTARLALDIIKL